MCRFRSHSHRNYDGGGDQYYAKFCDFFHAKFIRIITVTIVYAKREINSPTSENITCFFALSTLSSFPYAVTNLTPPIIRNKSAAMLANPVIPTARFGSIFCTKVSLAPPPSGPGSV